MKNLTILQREVLGLVDPFQGVEAAEIGLTVFSTREDPEGWQRFLLGLDADAGDMDVRVHCSIEVAGFIQRHCLRLVRGLIYRPDRLRYSVWSSLIGLDCLLNRDSIILPFGVLAARAGQLEALFGPQLFIRPDSARKLFTGFSLPAAGLRAETAVLAQSYGVQPEDLIVIDRARRLHPVEWRFWVSQGRVVACAPYALAEGGVPFPDDVDPSAEGKMRAMLEDILAASPMLETLDDMLVMDMATEIMGGAARLVEINAWSTSGFYPGADVPAILREQRFAGAH